MTARVENDIGDMKELEPDALSSLAGRIQERLFASKIPAEVSKNSKAPKKRAVGSNSSNLTSTTVAHTGKKRLRNGETKEPRKAGTHVRGDNGPLAGGRQTSLNPEIEEGILALDGEKDDYRLIIDAPSESELGEDDWKAEKAPKKGLTKEVVRFVRELGIRTLGHDIPELEDDETPGVAVPEPCRYNRDAETIAVAAKAATTTAKKLAKSGPSLLVEPQSDWHAISLPTTGGPGNDIWSFPADFLSRIQLHANALLEEENKRYGSRNDSSSSAHQFYSTIMSSGTLSDKISALTLSVQESPVHNMRALESLVGLARKRSRGQAVEVLGALKDLFGAGTLLPSDRKLRIFSNQPGLTAGFGRPNMQWTVKDALPPSVNKIHLILWAFEDWLKKIYFETIQILESWCNDEIIFARGKAIDYVYELLKEKPEQESNLLRLLINKLGDPDKKIASKTSYLILQLETTHPLMKPLIVSSIESELLFRPGQSLHAQYYAIITLNQSVLSGKEEKVAKKLLDIYFGLFTNLLIHPEQLKPAASAGNAISLNKKGEIQGGGGSFGRQARRKRAEKEKNNNVDEELREKLLSAVLTGVNRAVPFITIKDDSFEKHLDTLFKVTHSSNFNTSIQALMLIQQLCGTNQTSTDRFYRTLYESLLDPRLLNSSKQAMYLNLLFKGLRSDLNIRRVKAFTKRLLQVVTMHQPSFTCGVLYLLKELESVFASLQNFVDQPELDASDDDENFHDVPEESDLGAQQQGKPKIMHERNVSVNQEKQLLTYDGRKRDPEHSNAENSCLWELPQFQLHYHPSVTVFASRLLAHRIMPAKPDLSTNTLIHFLDRFVYRNPKKTTAVPRGSSVMQPMPGSDTSGLLILPRHVTESKTPVNKEGFWKMEANKVDADEVFFHKYFNTIGRGKEQAKKRKTDSKTGAEEGSDADDDEEEIWKALVDSRPEIEGEDASDGDLDLEDLDSVFGDSDAGIKADAEDVANQDLDEGEQSLDLEADDDDAMLNSDDEVPSEVDEVFKKELETNDGMTLETARTPSKRRRKLKNLPVFASADDYPMSDDEN